MILDFQTQLDIPELWLFLIHIFILAVQRDLLLNGTPLVTLYNVIERNNELKFVYLGGDARTDAYASILSSVAKELT